MTNTTNTTTTTTAADHHREQYAARVHQDREALKLDRETMDFRHMDFSS